MDPRADRDGVAPRDAAHTGHAVERPLARDAMDDARIVAAMGEHFNLVWRTLRRFGVDSGAADDAAQQVFLIFAGRLKLVEPGHERAFLLSVAIRVASNARRARSRSREVLANDECEPRRDSARDPEQMLDHKQRLVQLDRVLGELSDEQRVVFVLYELEGFSLPEIASALEIPLGTATSRLTRGRARFEEWVRTHHPSRETP
jgi:RNA polymerase sigma-70 factor (ECF subfamily)